MKSANTIEMDFLQTKQRADELDEIASEMRSLADRDLNDSMQTLSGAWKGEAAEAYLGKGEQLKERILATAGKLEKTAATIRKIAVRTYNAEMKAYRIAQERKYE